MNLVSTNSLLIRHIPLKHLNGLHLHILWFAYTFCLIGDLLCLWFNFLRFVMVVNCYWAFIMMFCILLFHFFSKLCHHYNSLGTHDQHQPKNLCQAFILSWWPCINIYDAFEQIMHFNNFVSSLSKISCIDRPNDYLSKRIDRSS